MIVNTTIIMMTSRALVGLQAGQRTLTPCWPTPLASRGSLTSCNKSSGDYDDDVDVNDYDDNDDADPTYSNRSSGVQVVRIYDDEDDDHDYDHHENDDGDD